MCEGVGDYVRKGKERERESGCNSYPGDRLVDEESCKSLILRMAVIISGLWNRCFITRSPYFLLFFFSISSLSLLTSRSFLFANNQG